MVKGNSPDTRNPNNIPLETIEHRKKAMMGAIASARIEGLIVSEVIKALIEDNIFGRISDEDLIERARALYWVGPSAEYDKLVAVSDDPYLLANGTMKNKLGIVEADKLSQAEADIVAVRTYQLSKNSVR